MPAPATSTNNSLLYTHRLSVTKLSVIVGSNRIALSNIQTVSELCVVNLTGDSGGHSKKNSRFRFSRF